MLLRAKHVVERVVDGELILYDPVRSRVHALNATAAFVWQGCDGQHDAESIAGELAALYPDSLAEIEADLPQVVRSLWEEGLLERT